MSVTAGFADSENSLIISRVIQGLAAGLFFRKSTPQLWICILGKALGKSSEFLALLLV